MLPACLSLLYSLLFLLEPVSDALSIHHFFSADFFIFCAGCFIIMILFLCCIKFLIKCLYRVKIMFFHVEESLFFILEICMSRLSISCCNSLHLPPLKMLVHSDNSFSAYSAHARKLPCSGLSACPQSLSVGDIYFQVRTFLVAAVFLLSAHVQSKQAFALPLSA